MRILSLCLVAVVVFAVVACGGDPSKQIIGKWKVDVEAMKNSDEYKNAEGAEKQMMDAMIAGMGAMVIEITADSIKGMGDERKYTITKTEGNVLTVESHPADNADDKDTSTITVEGGKLTVKRGDSDAMTLIPAE